MGEHALPQERRSHKRGRDALGSQFTGSKGQPILYQPRISGRIAARCGVRGVSALLLVLLFFKIGLNELVRTLASIGAYWCTFLSSLFFSDHFTF